MLLFNKELLSQMIKGNSLAKYVVALFTLFVLQIFNPLQESLLVGLGGALYYATPVVWFFFALCFASNRLVRKLMITIVIIGVLVSVYGLSQMIFGFRPFESYWIEHGGFVSLRVGRFIRSFSTFSSPEEYSRYIQIAGTIAFGYFLIRRNLLWLLLFGLVSFATVMVGVRASVFGLFLSVVVLLAVWRARSLGRAFIWLVLLGSAFFLIQASVSPPSREAVYQSESIFYTLGAHAARGFINPLAEVSFWSRLNVWSHLFSDILRRNPVGYGLGSTSIAAVKFGSSEIGTDSYVFSIFVNSGIAGGILFLIITLMSIKRATELSFQSEDNKALCRLVLAVTAGLALTNIYGQSFIVYSVAPIGWFLIGYLARQTNSQTKVQQDG